MANVVSSRAETTAVKKPARLYDSASRDSDFGRPSRLKSMAIFSALLWTKAGILRVGDLLLGSFPVKSHGCHFFPNSTLSRTKTVHGVAAISKNSTEKCRETWITGLFQSFEFIGGKYERFACQLNRRGPPRWTPPNGIIVTFL